MAPAGGILDSVTRPNRPRLDGARRAPALDGVTVVPPGFRQHGSVRFILMLHTAETITQSTISGPNITYLYISVIWFVLTGLISQLTRQRLPGNILLLMSLNDLLLYGYCSVTSLGAVSIVTRSSKIKVNC